MHSAWGTFEWILTDGFPIGRRVGVVCNSDGHKGRPGASYPGDSIFGSLGGLTCFLTDKNDRDSIFEAQRRRHHYGTTGCRMHMDLRVNLPEVSTLYERNPAAMPDTATHQVDNVMMGDIVQTAANAVELAVSVKAHAGIERIEIRNGAKVLETLRPYSEHDLSNRIRVLWSGAEYRGRDRITTWNGRTQFSGTAIERFQSINQWNPDQLFEQRGSDTVIWKTVTTGNFMGFDAWLADKAGHISVTTNHGALSLDLTDVGLEDVVLDVGGLERKLKVSRLPNAGLAKEMTFTRNIEIKKNGDNPIWICVFTEDGFQAWSSPIYVFR